MPGTQILTFVFIVANLHITWKESLWRILSYSSVDWRLKCSQHGSYLKDLSLISEYLWSLSCKGSIRNKNRAPPCSSKVCCKQFFSPSIATLTFAFSFPLSLGKTIKCLHLQYKCTSKTPLWRKPWYDRENDRCCMCVGSTGVPFEADQKDCNYSGAWQR